MSKPVETEVLIPASVSLRFRRGQWRVAIRPTELSDSDILPFREGKYAGQRLGDIPDSYWRWFLKQDWCDRWPQLVEYANLCVDMSSVEDS